MQELVTVVIPAYNEEKFLGACLESVRGQTYDDLQVIVVDGGSTDGTRTVIQHHMSADPRIELIHNPQRTIPISLNLAVAAARGRWLVRVDAHSTVEPSYVQLAVDHLVEGSWGGVGGRKDGVGRTPAGRAIAAAMSSRFGVGGSVYHHGSTTQQVDHLPFGAYPVDVVRELGGWDESLVANEDFEFDYRLRLAGWALLFDPRMVISWHCRQSIHELFGQYVRYGRGKVDVARLHPSSLRPRHLLPQSFVAYLAGAALLGVRRPAVATAMLAPYGIGLGVASAKTAQQLGAAPERAYVPLAFMAMHVGWGVGFWWGVGEAAMSRLRKRQSDA